MTFSRSSVAGKRKKIDTIAMDLTRRLDLASAVRQRSLLLLGPRQTGKSTLLRSLFPGAPYYNLLHTDVYFRLQGDPSRLRQEIRALPPSDQPIIIDEVQKLPILLDEVQALIDEGPRRFLLTGSSARKLKAGGANLLGGRARLRHLFPFVSSELGFSTGQFDLTKALAFGLLPPVWFSESPEEDLQAYCGTYLKEEIQAEAMVRKLEGFSRFLQVAGLGSGQELNFEALARDCAVPARTVREYTSILTDTLLAQVVEPWRFGTRRKPVSSVKLYFFDLGVARVLSNRRPPQPDSREWGMALEQFIFQELRAWIGYQGSHKALCYWRTTDHREVDFIVGYELAIEVKATRKLVDTDFKGLREIQQEATWRQRMVVCQEPVPRTTDDGILVLPVTEFLQRLWSGTWD